LLFNQVLPDYAEKAPNAMHVLEKGFYDVTTVFALPENAAPDDQRRREDHLRGSGAVSAFTYSQNRATVLRLLRALLVKMDEKCATGNQYLDMREYWKWYASRIPIVKRGVDFLQFT
jgi:putative transposase